MPEKSLLFAALAATVIASFVATPAAAIAGLVGGITMSAVLWTGHAIYASRRANRQNVANPTHGVTQCRDEMWTYPDFLATRS